MEALEKTQQYFEKFKIDFESFFERYLEERVREFAKIDAVGQILAKKILDFSTSGGKRIRPALVILGYQAGGGIKAEDVFPAAVTIELLHNFLLIHDDIIDLSEIRRGQPTMHKMFEVGSKRVRGVALIVQNSDSKILVLQEYETKPYVGKYSGMFSIPMETSKPDEPNSRALVRLVEEELPGLSLPLEDALESYIGIYRIVSRVWVNLYLAKTTSSYLPMSNNLKNKEVGNYQWMDPQKALNLWLRQGAWEMISDFVNNKKGVRCKCCRAPHINGHI